MGLKKIETLCQAVRKEKERRSLHTKERKEQERIDTRRKSKL